ncbi:MAG: MBL fold metallo-hydrolase [Chloroflexi bacterium]|nr:MBL fold metallo-hydrolase [Chloroflexota bacterium]
MKGRGFVVGLALAVALLAVACVVPAVTPTPSPTPTPTPTRTPTASPAATPTPTPTPTPTAAPAGTTQLQYLGHSAFLLTSSQGTKVLIDPPAASTGYTIAPIAGIDVVLVTHEHSDHNNVSVATGSPLILRGLSASGWNEINQKVGDEGEVAVRSVATFHDNSQGSARGRNAVFVLEVDGLRLAHLGDLGHVLTPEQVLAMGAIDVLIVPVGGNFTIDAAGATQVVGQLNPKVAIPMHYKTEARPTWAGEAVDPFLVGKTVQRPNSTTISLSKATLPAATTVVVLNYK